MATVFASLHSKGGSGKSLVALCLAEALALDGSSVLVLDTDPQGTAKAYSRTGGEVMVVGTPSADKLEEEIERLGSGYDAIVIDGSARLQGSTGAIIRLSDLVLIPVQPSPADLWATANIVGLIQERREVVGHPVAGFVLNRVKASTNLANEVGEILEQFDLPVVCRLHDRVAFQESLISGETPMSYRPGGKAASEQETLLEATLDLLEASNGQA